MFNLAIFQDINFIYNLCMYAIIEVARSRVSLMPVSPSMGWLLHSDTEGISRKKIAPLYTFFRWQHASKTYVRSFVSARPHEPLSSSLLAIPPTYIFFFFFYYPSRLFISRLDATGALYEGDYWRVVNFINGPHPCRGWLRFKESRCIPSMLYKRTT